MQYNHKFFVWKTCLSSLFFYLGLFGSASAASISVPLTTLFPSESASTLNAFSNSLSAPLTADSNYKFLYNNCGSFSNTAPACATPSKSALGVVTRVNATQAQKAMNAMTLYCPQGISIHPVTIASGKMTYASDQILPSCVGDMNITYYRAATTLKEPYVRCDAEVIACGSKVAPSDCPKSSETHCYPAISSSSVSNPPSCLCQDGSTPTSCSSSGVPQGCPATPSGCNAGEKMISAGPPAVCAPCNSSPGTYNSSAGSNPSCTSCTLADVGGSAPNSVPSSYQLKSVAPFTSPHDCRAQSFSCLPGYAPDLNTNTCTCIMSGTATSTPPTTSTSNDGSFVITLTNATSPWRASVNGTSYGSNSFTVTNLPARDYTVVFTDGPSNTAGTCKAPVNVTVGANTCPSSYALSETHSGISYQGASDGSITVSGAGGFVPTTYNIIPQAGSQSTLGQFSGLPSQSYMITAQGQSQCSQSISVFVGGPSLPLCTALACPSGTNKYYFESATGMGYYAGISSYTGSTACNFQSNPATQYVACGASPPPTNPASPPTYPPAPYYVQCPAPSSRPIGPYWGVVGNSPCQIP